MNWSGTIGEYFKNFGDPADGRSFGGVVPAYPIFMLIGIILVIGLSIIKLKMKKIPLKEFELAIVIVVPIGVIGGSIFGKIFIPDYVWYEVFFFWQPGMSLFGALAFGIASGFILFYIRSKKTLISVWTYADCIIPNILIGQALGRWGNMYNHEILGQIVSYDSLSWLPNAIRNKLFYFPNLSGFYLPDGWWNMSSEWSSYKAEAGSAFEGNTLADVLNWTSEKNWLINSVTQEALDPTKYNYGTLQFRAPLFLYESICDLVLWVIITFGVANIGRLFSKPKPWDLEPKAYPGWYNKKYKAIKEADLININTQVPIKYKRVQVQTNDGEVIELKLGFYQAWNKAFYWYQPDESNVREAEQALELRKVTLDQNLTKLQKVKSEHNGKLNKIEIDCKRKVNNLHKSSPKYIQAMIDKKSDIKNESVSFKNKKKEIYDVIGNWTRFFIGDPTGSIYLNTINNPNKFSIIRVGVETGTYIFAYMLTRIILETQRKSEELFVQNSYIADFIVLALLLIIGVVVIVYAQFISPYRYREVNWLYEKSY